MKKRATKVVFIDHPTKKSDRWNFAKGGCVDTDMSDRTNVTHIMACHSNIPTAVNQPHGPCPNTSHTFPFYESEITPVYQSIYNTCVST